ncbi:MAG: DUF2927 domain-containing protein [Albidovulum sp.]
MTHSRLPRRGPVAFETMLFRISIRALLIPAALAGLSACETFAPEVAPPLPTKTAPSAPSQIAPSAESATEATYYARIEANYLEQERLRTDGGGADTPFSADDLAKNFLRIAFYDEFAEEGERLVSSATENQLYRWQEPVRLNVEFGPSVPLEQRAADLAAIEAYVARLSTLTGLPIRVTTWRPNHTVMIVNAGEREDAAKRIKSLAPGISEAALNSVAEMSPDIYCTVFGFTRGRSTSYTGAATVIRGELPTHLRQMCIHEELAQSLGLVADYPYARPSIFNDNEEFAALTGQDELMLKMLYDRRLRTGMTLNEARPIVEAMAAELMGGDS